MNELTMGARIKALRKKNGYNQKEFASKLGMSPHAVYLWETDKVVPLGKNLQIICDILHTTETYLKNGRIDEKSVNTKAVTVHVDNPNNIKEVVSPTRASIFANAPKQEPKRYSRRDKRILEDLELLIGHMSDLNLDRDTKKSLYETIAELRNEYESKVLFGK